MYFFYCLLFESEIFTSTGNSGNDVIDFFLSYMFSGSYDYENVKITLAISGIYPIVIFNMLYGTSIYKKNIQGDYFMDNDNLNSINNRRKLSKNRNKYIGYISQNYKLIDNFTVFNNIAVPLMLRNAKLEDILTDVKEIAERFDIGKLLEKPVVKLSGGERQRVCIARAVVGKPSIVIADEPTAALDKENTDIIIKYLKEINKISTIILASHDDRVINNCNIVYSIKI